MHAEPADAADAVAPADVASTAAALADQWASTIIIMGIGIGAIVVFIKFWPLLSNAVAIGNALLALPRLIEKVDRIEKEVLPNHGSSFRDDFTTFASATNERFASLEGSNLSQHMKLNSMTGAVDDVRNAVAPPKE